MVADELSWKFLSYSSRTLLGFNCQDRTQLARRKVKNKTVGFSRRKVEFCGVRRLPSVNCC